MEMFIPILGETDFLLRLQSILNFSIFIQSSFMVPANK